MHADFGSHLDHLSDEMCQMKTKIGHIARWQSHLSGFTPPSPDLVEESYDGGDDESDDTSGSPSNDEVTVSQWFTFCHLWQKGGVVLIIRVVMMLGRRLE